ncbi:MAG: transposase [Cytophagaceae bacterium]|nr:MAG: transposase [Cytophagaceae bacterium]
MPYPIRDQQGLYFLTFTAVSWADIFTRPVYKDLLIDSLRYCQQHKGLGLYAYCLMTNHLHLIARAAEGYELSDIVRDFKKFTARALFKELEHLPTESRRSWLRCCQSWKCSLLGLRAPSCTSSQRSHGVELRTEEMVRQRLHYTHENPVRAGICYKAEDYVYSSASFYAGLAAVLPVTLLFCAAMTAAKPAGFTTP